MLICKLRDLKIVPRSRSVPHRPRPRRGGPVAIPAGPRSQFFELPRALAGRAGIQAAEDRVRAEPDLGVGVSAAPEQPSLVRRSTPPGVAWKRPRARARTSPPADRSALDRAREVDPPGCGRDHELLDAPDELEVAPGSLVRRRARTGRPVWRPGSRPSIVHSVGSQMWPTRMPSQNTSATTRVGQAPKSRRSTREIDASTPQAADRHHVVADRPGP